MLFSTVFVSVIAVGDADSENQSNASTLLFSDDFDDGTLDKWVISDWMPEGVLEVTSDVSLSAPYSMHVQSDPGSNTGPWAGKHLGAEYYHIMASTWIYLPNKTQEFDQLTLLRINNLTKDFLDPATDVYDYKFKVNLEDDDYNIDVVELVRDDFGVLQRYERGFDLYPLLPNTWYNISLEIHEMQFAIYVNGISIMEDTRYGDMPLDTIILGDTKGSGGGWGDAYWDDVKVWEIPEESASVDLSISEGDITFSDPNPQVGDAIIIGATVHNNDYQTSNGSLIYTFTGTYDSNLGRAVSPAGDINNDGYDDIIVGTGYGGFARVYSGISGDLLYQFYGVGSSSGAFGESVAGIGDINNDGYDDVIIGDRHDNAVAENSGAATIYSGMTGEVLRFHTGTDHWDMFGNSVANAGDVNKDGHTDYIIGSNWNDTAGRYAGAAYVYDGQTGNVIWSFYGHNVGDHFGTVVSGAGDVDNDGYDDLIIGVPGWDGTHNVMGRAYVYSGLTGDELYDISEATGEYNQYGACVAGVNDVNNDGYDDFAVGASGMKTIWVYSGITGDILYQWTDSDTMYEVAPAKDIDNDGYDDILVGAQRWGTNDDGRVFIYSGQTGNALYEFPAESMNEYFGFSVANVGDINNDGYYEIIIGAPHWEIPGGNTEGRVYVYTLNPFYNSTTPGLDATCTVSFYLDSVSPGNLIDQQFNVFVPDGGETTVYSNWTAITGNHTIIVEVSDVDPDDYDYSNNIAGKSIHIDSGLEVDLSISDSDITFSNDSPLPGETINVEAVVHGDPDTGSSSTTSDLIFFDDFDNGTLNKWAKSDWMPEGVCEATNAVSHSGNYSLHIQSDPNVDTGPWVGKYLGEEYSSLIVETWVYLPDKIQEINQTVLLSASNLTKPYFHPSNDTYDYWFRINLDNDNYCIDVFELVVDDVGVRHRHTRGIDLYELSPETWHHIELEIHDSEFIICVDGSVIMEDIRIGTSPMDTVILGDTRGSSGGWGDAYWDDVKFWEITENYTSEPGLDAFCDISFYMDECDEAHLIDRIEGLFVPGDSDIPVSTDWTAVPGNHTIYVDVSNVDPEDYDYSNNRADKIVWVEEAETPEVDIYITGEDIILSEYNSSIGEAVEIEATVHGDESSSLVSTLIDWKISGEFHLTYRNHPDGCEWARPIWLGNLTDYVGVIVYGGNSQINNYKDTVVIRASGYGPDNPPMYPDEFFKGSLCHYYSSSGGNGYYDDGYYVEFWYQSSDNMFYGKICDAANHDVIFASGNIEANNYSYSDFSVGRAFGTDAYNNFIYEGWVDDVSLQWSEDGLPGYENSEVYDFSATHGFTKVDDQANSDVYWNSANHNVFFHADRLDPMDTGERLEKPLPCLFSNVANESQPEPGLDAFCTVSFYIDEIAPENLIHQEFNVFVPGGDQTTVYANWTTDVMGDHDIIVDVSNVDPEDIDYSNNTASASIHVEAIPEVDLSIYPDDIVLPGTPTQGVPATIEATVHGDIGVDGGWQKLGVVLDAGGVKEDGSVAAPFVMKMANGTYAIWYCARSLNYSHNYETRIFRAFSYDGLVWEKQGMVLDYGGAYQEYGVNYPYVYRLNDGSLSMWYTGISYNSGYRYHIHRAISDDEGLTWQKLGRELTYGGSGDPDGSCTPYVLYDGTQWHMWYTGVDWTPYPYQDRICHAHKTNLNDTWIKDGVVLDNDGPYDYPLAFAPSVIQTGDSFEMYYEGISPDIYGDRRILSAVSDDGLHWNKTGIVIEPSLPLEGNFTSQPSLINDNGVYKLWYVGLAPDGHGYILYAEKNLAEPGMDATCTVSFYLDSVAPENLINQETNVFVPGGGETTVYANWTPEIEGDHEIVVVVSDVNPEDYDYSNNMASTSIYVEVIAEVDLFISSEDIVLPESPNQGAPTTIEATVHGDLGVDGGWEKYGIILDVGGTGESLHVGKPSVIQMPNGTYAMWYHGTDASYGYSIFRAWSPDGIIWHKQGVVMQKGGAYQETAVYVPYVYVHESVYHMWYGGIFQSGGNRASIHYATSTDEGFTWQKQGIELYHNDGVTSPYVLYDGSEWQMWYCGIYWGSPNQGRIHHAHKASLSDPWIKDGVVLNNDGPYDYPTVAYPCVLPTATGYEMYYTGYTPYTGPSRILHATSTDGLTWTKTGIVLEGTLPEESNFVGYADLIKEGNTLKCWYSGYDGAHWRIFYAENNPEKPGLDATCTVSFYLDSVSPENLIHQEFNVFVPGGGETTVYANWTPTVYGDHDIIVVVSNVNPEDYDYSNNIASITTNIWSPSTATATGPQGAHHDPVITITYDWTENPSAVDLYYSTNNGDNWHYLATDTSVDGSFDWEPEANPGPKPCKYWWIANAKNGADDVGVPADGTEPEAGPFNWKTWDVCENAAMTFSPGGDNWYFISFPIAATGDVQTVFDDTYWGDGGTTWDIIQWYDPCENVWRTYATFKPPVLNDMPSVDNTMGLWIHLTSNIGDGVLTVGEGSMPASTTIDLYSGWNMVGYPTQDKTKTVSEVFWGTGADKVEVFDPYNPYKLREVGPSYVMMPGEGYWVHVPSDTTWVVDW